MRVSERAVSGIVLQIMVDLAPASESLVDRAALDRRWSDVGLRQTDLELALRLLEDAAALERACPDTFSPEYRLTDAGRRQARRLSMPLWLGLTAHARLRRKAARRLNRRKTH